jgi:AraC-like DNA-binding protein
MTMILPPSSEQSDMPQSSELMRSEMTSPAPLSAFNVMRTRDYQVARDALLDVYGATRFERIGGDQAFEARANFVKLGPVALSFCQYSDRVQIDFPAATFVRQQICFGGAGRTSFGSTHIDIDANNWSAMVPAGVDVSFDYLPSFRQIIMWIESETLERSYAAMMGLPRARLSFDKQADVRSPALQAMRRSVAFLVDELEISGRDSSPLALAELQDVIVTRFLLAHQPQLIGDEPRPAPVASRPRMRRLEEYLREHWNQPLTIETLAETTGIGARSIFRYFKETRGCTPLDYMKTLRLEQARKALQQPCEETTVSSEALRCGFNNMGHFAKDYRRKFGELPSETLFKARLR